MEAGHHKTDLEADVSSVKKMKKVDFSAPHGTLGVRCPRNVGSDV